MAQVKDKNFGQSTSQIANITNVETIAVVSNAIIMPNPTAHILVRGTVLLVNGVGAGTVKVSVYRGTTLTDPLRYFTPNLSIGAAGALAVPFEFQEDLANAAGAQYMASVTFSVNQAGNNIWQSNITVEVL